MTTITKEQQAAIAAKLDGMTLPSGLGDKHNACSIAAINLALTGKLTDDIPDCMSEVIGGWIIGVQDDMPADMRNSKEWKQLLPLAAGTGRALEQERVAIILDWMWVTVLPAMQPLADANGFGKEWTAMTTEKTAAAARAAAARAADADADAAARAAAYAVAAAYAYAAAYADAAAYATDAAVAARAARAAAAVAVAARAAVWRKFDPCALLQKLINVEAA